MLIPLNYIDRLYYTDWRGREKRNRNCRSNECRRAPRNYSLGGEAVGIGMSRIPSPFGPVRESAARQMHSAPDILAGRNGVRGYCLLGARRSSISMRYATSQGWSLVVGSR